MTYAAKEIPGPGPDELPPFKEPAPQSPPMEVPFAPDPIPSVPPVEVPAPPEPPGETPPKSTVRIGPIVSCGERNHGRQITSSS